jgi:hypothetical protein
MPYAVPAVAISIYHTLAHAARCIDQYVEARVKAAEAHQEAQLDPRLTAIVERLFDRCAVWHAMAQALPSFIALSACRCYLALPVMQMCATFMQMCFTFCKCANALAASRCCLVSE